MTTNLKNVYLKNKDLLLQIHKSKLQFCWKEDRKYGDYDIILHDLKHFHNRKTIAFPEGALNIAKATRAKRFAEALHKEAIKQWEEEGKRPSKKPKMDQFMVPTKSISNDEIVVRLMDWDHIPEEPGRKTNPKTPADYRAKVNFPPFKHYVKEEGEWKEVVRSHWKGDLETGHFSIDHGKITNKLGAMFLKLCERYSLRSNWRGYSYIDEMRGQALIQLTQIALQFDESKSQNPFAYYTAAVTNSFTRVLNVEKRQRDIRDDLLQEAGQTPSWTRQAEHIEKVKAEVERALALKEAEKAEKDKEEKEPLSEMIGHNNPPPDFQ